jgi:hypothetical protein
VSPYLLLLATTALSIAPYAITEVRRAWRRRRDARTLAGIAAATERADQQRADHDSP